MDIQIIDAKNFNTLTQEAIPYNVDGIYSTIAMMNQRIAQKIANAQDEARRQIEPDQAEIQRLTDLLTAAAALGIDTKPPLGLPDASPLVATLDSTQALSIATPTAKIAPTPAPLMVDATSTPSSVNTLPKPAI